MTAGAKESNGHRLAATVALLASLVFGAFVAVQSRINGELGLELGDGFVAALISFGVGFVLLVLGMLILRQGRVGLARVREELRTRRTPWWMVLGGAGGAFLVLCQGLTAATLGVALFTVATVCGQTFSALLIDRRGLGTMAPKPLTPPRVVGTALALVAVVVAVSSRIQTDVPVWMFVLPLLAGVGIGWQQAVNGQVRGIAGSALTATFINFLVGTTVLLIAAIVHVLVAGPPQPLPADPVLYAGGAIGVVFIAGFAVAVRHVGVLAMGLASISGQLIMSVVLDVVVPAPGHEVVASSLVGTALTLVAVGIAAVPWRRGAAPDPATAPRGASPR